MMGGQVADENSAGFELNLCPITESNEVEDEVPDVSAVKQAREFMQLQVKCRSDHKDATICEEPSESDTR